MGLPFWGIQRKKPVIFQSHEELMIKEAILENPTVTLNEIFDEIHRSKGSEFALSSIHYYLKRKAKRQSSQMNELD